MHLLLFLLLDKEHIYGAEETGAVCVEKNDENLFRHGYTYYILLCGATASFAVS
jgi:hypothetical protein